MGRSRTSQPSQYGHTNALRPQILESPSISGSASIMPVANSTRSAKQLAPFSNATRKRFGSFSMSDTVVALRRTVGYDSACARAMLSIVPGGVPSRDRNPCTSSAHAFRCKPLLHNRTSRRARPSRRAAFKPAAPPPTMTTSYSDRIYDGAPSLACSPSATLRRGPTSTTDIRVLEATFLIGFSSAFPMFRPVTREQHNEWFFCRDPSWLILGDCSLESRI